MGNDNYEQNRSPGGATVVAGAGAAVGVGVGVGMLGDVMVSLHLQSPFAYADLQALVI